ncbi:MAG: hypothetical protein HQL97_07990 [Magnetococcales bacterium]|nr:hypothetical protein [Magnetococcales bacterium]
MAPTPEADAGNPVAEVMPSVPGMPGTSGIPGVPGTLVGATDQGDAVEMGHRLGKFMGSFMREMKTPQEQATGEGVRGEPRMREPTDGRRGTWSEYDQGGRRGDQREMYRYMPLYDPWGMTERGSPYPEWELGENRPYYGRPNSPGYGNSWNEPGSLGWAAINDWDRTRGYYGAGLSPWEAREPPPDPRAERRWHDPSYYEPPRMGPGYRLPEDEPQAAPRSYRPWNDGYRRGSWW